MRLQLRPRTGAHAAAAKHRKTTWSSTCIARHHSPHCACCCRMRIVPVWALICVVLAVQQQAVQAMHSQSVLTDVRHEVHALPTGGHLQLHSLLHSKKHSRQLQTSALSSYVPVWLYALNRCKPVTMSVQEVCWCVAPSATAQIAKRGAHQQQVLLMMHGAAGTCCTVCRDLQLLCGRRVASLHIWP